MMTEPHKKGPRKGHSYRGARRTSEKRKVHLEAQRFHRRARWNALGLADRLSVRLGSKAEYEARKAERHKLKDMDLHLKQRTSEIMMLDLLDRFVTAAERIADALEDE